MAKNIVKLKKTDYTIYRIFNITRCIFKSLRYEIFLKRNLFENAKVRMYGLHNMRPKKISPSHQPKLLKFFWFLEWVMNFILGKFRIPQLEVVLTTKCTLKCKHCTNYIPSVEKNEHIELSLNDFKYQMDNLLKAVDCIQNLLLLGGEPLLLKDITEIFKYAASKKKIKRVWIVTNATITPSDELIQALKKYRKKCTVWISNYSGNSELSPMLKAQSIIKTLKENKIEYKYKENLMWNYVQPYKKNNRTEDENIQYFIKCLHKCTSLANGKINVCPRAGTFYIKKMINDIDIEQVDLNETNANTLKEQLYEFYSRYHFSACDFCNRNTDILEEKVQPAIQIK